MARFNRGSFQGSSKRTPRRPGWSVGPSGVVQRTASGSSVFPTSAVVASSDVTLIRTRGIFEVFLSVGTAALDGFDGAVGICKVSENAAGVGSTAIPQPVTDIAWDGWLWYQQFSVKVVTATIADGVNAVGAYSRFIIDSKAMRKSNATDNFVAVMEVTEVGTATVNARLATRMLTKIMV